MGVDALAPSFVHLHVHSQYSLLEATCTAKKLAKVAAEMGMPALALTDYGNMYGAVEFYFACQSEGVKPILGLEVYLAPKGRFVKGEDRDSQQPNTRLVLLAKNFKGYQNLCQISTIGFKEGFYYKPRVDVEILKMFSSDLVALSGGLMGDVAYHFREKGPEVAKERVQLFQEIYGDDFYLEVCKTGVPGWEELTPFLKKCGQELGVELVATNDVHYVNQEDQLAQEVLICVGTNKTLMDENRFRLGSDQFYFKSQEAMRGLFRDDPKLLENTLIIADKCNVTFKLKDEEGRPIYHLPSYPTQGGRSLTEEIKSLAFKGLEIRFKEAESRGEGVHESQHEEYFSRLNFELGVIDGMGFNGYFLIVQDFIKWAKENDIPVGPGRGSGAGSLVAYCLFITDLDPIPNKLIFERFLNPERVSMPDFDIDFCQDNRGRVIEYVTQKYGAESVSQIVTYGKLQTRAALRDVGRVMGMTFSEVDVISKLIPDKLGIGIQESIDTEPRIREIMEQDPKIQTLMDLALKVEGLVRHAGIHAAGVVIADGNIVDHAPLCKGANGENVVQYDMKHAEKIGLIKFDFLGLKTLTHIQDAFRLIKKNRGQSLSPTDISLSDPGIYELIGNGDNLGVFQFEGEGITDLTRKAKPDRFEDLVTITALYRPGPMEMIPEWLEKKSGLKKVKYLFDELEPILSETYGVIVFQEQVQLVAAKIANYSLGEADMLRRAMGKKIAEEMERQKARFLKGASENNFDLKKAGELFDLMAEFAKYGFNKSHAAAYCVVTAQTAWLKHYYPVEFFAALLNTEMDKTDGIVKYVKDAWKHKIEVLPPHVNSSEYRFTVDGDKIYFSFGAIKGVGQGAAESIVQARESLPNKKFESLAQFFESIDLKRVNKKTLESLIKAGALDGFGHNRNELLSGYSKYIERAHKSREEREMGQVSLFSMVEDEVEGEVIHLDKQPMFPKMVRLGLEKEVLGFYLTDHPLQGMDPLFKDWVSGKVEGLSELEPKSKVQMLGLLHVTRELITKKGTRMAFGQFEDLSGSIETVIFPNTFAEVEAKLKIEDPVIITAVLEKEDGGSQKLILEEIKTLDTIYSKIKKVSVLISQENESKLSLLKEVMKKHSGETGFELALELKDLNKIVGLEIKDTKGILPSPVFFEDLLELIENPQSIHISHN
ncbi:DNA polymerase III subunit alpha [bacterium]|nr:DNA polymerase III subunit alpha [bacterium]